MKTLTQAINTVLGAGLLAASAGAMAASPQQHHIELDEMQQRLTEMQQVHSQLQAEIERLQSELGMVKSGEPEQNMKVHKLEERVANVESSMNKSKVIGNRVFFRGGSANLVEDRGFGAFSDTQAIALGAAPNRDDSGWYFGAGFDFLLSEDTLGLLPGTWTLAELAFEYRHLGSEDNIIAVPTVACLSLAGGLGAGAAGNTSCIATGEQDLSMLTVSAAPKLKFMAGSKLRPWLIPAGFAVTVISPPSDSSNYVDVGGFTGAGVDYELIPGITLGADIRYHWTADTTDPEHNQTTISSAALTHTLDTDQENDNWTAGISLGIGF